MNDALLDTAPLDHPDGKNPWLPVTIKEWGGPDKLLDYDGGKVTVHWDYQADAKRWEQNGQINPASSCHEKCCSTGLDGRLWIHSETPVGTYPPKLVGAQRADYRITNLGEADGSGLSNSYIDIAPDDCKSNILSATLPPTIPFPPLLPRIFIRWPYPDPLYPGLTPPVPWWNEASREDAMLFQLEDGRYGLFRDDSYFVVIDDLLGSVLKQELDDPSLVWASAVEPAFEATRRHTSLGIQALAFRSDGTGLADAAISSGSGMIALSELRLGDPPPRKDFVPVFSRVAYMAFVVGGLQPGSDQPTGDIWYIRTGGNASNWRRVPLSGYAPEHVKAATWSARDHLLWVLDDEPRAAGHGDDQMRLVRIDPHLGVAMPIAKWRRDGYDGYYLSIDHDGNVLFTRASTRTPRYVVARYSAKPWETNVTPVVVDCVLRHGTLIASPLVDPGGYTFVTRDHGVPHVDRVSALTQGALAAPPGLCKL